MMVHNINVKEEIILLVICSQHRPLDFVDCITDLREYDVPYHVRFCIDIGKPYFNPLILFVPFRLKFL